MACVLPAANHDLVVRSQQLRPRDLHPCGWLTPGEGQPSAHRGTNGGHVPPVPGDHAPSVCRATTSLARPTKHRPPPSRGGDRQQRRWPRRTRSGGRRAIPLLRPLVGLADHRRSARSRQWLPHQGRPPGRHARIDESACRTTANCDPDGNLGSDAATSVTNVRSPLPGSDELTQAWASYPRIEPIDLEPTGWRMR
jgi:hypothetical protein